MKKLLILVLLIGLLAAAFFTRPQDPKTNFTNYLVDKTSKGDSVIPAAWNSMLASQFADRCIYKDRFLWVDVVYNDKTVYTGAFSHWFNRAELKHEAQDDIQKAKEKIDQTADKLSGK